MNRLQRLCFAILQFVCCLRLFPTAGARGDSPRPPLRVTNGKQPASTQDHAITGTDSPTFYADRFCVVPGRFDETCAQFAYNAAFNFASSTPSGRGAQIVFGPHDYTVGVCINDPGGDGRWGVLMNGYNSRTRLSAYGVHIHAEGTRFILGVNDAACRMFDVRNQYQFTWDGGVFLTAFPYVGTAITIDGSGLNANTFEHMIFGANGNSNWGTPANGWNIAIDNGGTDNGTTIDAQTFKDNRFQGNHTDIVQRGKDMTNQVYDTQVSYDAPDSQHHIMFDLQSGGITTIRNPVCELQTTIGPSSCFKLYLHSGAIDVYAPYSEQVSDAAAPWIEDTGSYGFHVHGGSIGFYGSRGTAASPVDEFELSASIAVTSYIFDNVDISAPNGGYKGFHVRPSGANQFQHNGRDWGSTIVTYGSSVPQLIAGLRYNTSLGQDMMTTGTPPFGDLSHFAATTQFVADSGMHYRNAPPLSIKTDTVLRGAQANHYFLIDANGLTVKLPSLTDKEVARGSTYTFVANFAFTLVGSGTDPIAGPTKHGVAYSIPQGETVTMTSGDPGGHWQVTAEGRAGSGYNGTIILGGSAQTICTVADGLIARCH